jgi:DNA-binding response OmpR family regulator
MMRVGSKSIVDNDPRPLHLVDHREPRRVSTPILVVEDDPQLRVMFQLLLEGEGYPVVAAADGLEAVRAVRSMRPSLVILDLELPRLDGRAVAFELRAAYGPSLPIVVVTATGQGVEAADGINPCAYLHKPFDVDGFLTLVWQCLSSPAAEGKDAPSSHL